MSILMSGFFNGYVEVYGSPLFAIPSRRLKRIAP